MYIAGLMGMEIKKKREKEIMGEKRENRQIWVIENDLKCLFKTK